MRSALTLLFLSAPFCGAATPIALTDAEVARGLRQALVQGADRAVLQLGRDNGFLANETVRIPVPPSLARVDVLLRKVGMRDYSEQRDVTPHLGRVRVLEDTDADGRYDKASIFADDLAWPTALIWANGGLFVASVPDILFFQDKDGDGRAETREGRTGVRRRREPSPGAAPSPRWSLLP